MGGPDFDGLWFHRTGASPRGANARAWRAKSARTCPPAACRHPDATNFFITTSLDVFSAASVARSSRRRTAAALGAGDAAAATTAGLGDVATAGLTLRAACDGSCGARRGAFASSAPHSSLSLLQSHA